jgi:hypothetical protein
MNIFKNISYETNGHMKLDCLLHAYFMFVRQWERFNGSCRQKQPPESFFFQIIQFSLIYFQIE